MCIYDMNKTKSVRLYITQINTFNKKIQKKLPSVSVTPFQYIYHLKYISIEESVI